MLPKHFSMKQTFNSKELIRHLKTGELIRNGIDIDNIKDELDTLENEILSETFEFDIADSGNFFDVKNLSEKLVLRKLNDNVRRIYKDEQANRKFIIQQVKTLLKEDAPFWVIKTDIKSFYESIDRQRILKKLKDDAMLSYYSINLLRKIFNNPTVRNEPGLPRGLNTSATLSEIYLRKFDKWLQCYPGVYFNARFVDDIIIFVSNKEQALELWNSIESKLDHFCSLKINWEKTELIDGTNFKVLQNNYSRTVKHNHIEYLGYRFSLDDPNKKRDKVLHISIADKKVKKIKTRLVNSFLDYIDNKNFALLLKRIQFLTGNYGIKKSNDGSILKAGIFFNYTHINQTQILDDLNIFLRKIIYSRGKGLGLKLYPLLNNNQKNVLKRYCFKSGFKNKTYKGFSYADMGDIINCWKQ
jgi:hypothetical protein